MSALNFEIPNIGCAGCVDAITTELIELEGVFNVSGELSSKIIQVEFRAPATAEGIVETLKAIDYPPAHS